MVLLARSEKTDMSDEINESDLLLGRRNLLIFFQTFICFSLIAF